MPLNPNDFLFDVTRQLKAAGLPDLDDATLAEAYQGLTHPAAQQQFDQGQLTPEIVVREVQRGLQRLKGPRLPVGATPGAAPANLPRMDEVLPPMRQLQPGGQPLGLGADASSALGSPQGDVNVLNNPMSGMSPGQAFTPPWNPAMQPYLNRVFPQVL